VQRNKAIVGQNAFAHEAGIHQHGVLQNRLTYEIMKPEDVGFSKSNLVLGKHSGRHAFRERLSELGYQFEKDVVDRMFQSFKKLADRKKEIHDADLEALVEGRVQDFARSWDIEDLHVSTGTSTLSTATICLRHAENGKIREAACGIGPVEAVFNAVERATGTDLRLKDYQIRGMTSGRDAEGEVSVEVEYAGRRLRSRAVSRDIIEASAHAFLRVVNRIAVNASQRKEEVVGVTASR
jgi:2-isopropylmalate synthase